MTQSIDLRSDTVTKPTAEMLQFMLNAKVGDDVFDEDPTISYLEKKCAFIFGMDAGLFCPSGTMTNQIGINVLSNPYNEVICYKGSHIYKYEGGGVAGNSGLSFRLLEGDQGRITLVDVAASVNPDDIHFPITSVLSLENTVNKGGGSCYDLADIKKICSFGKKNNIKTHLDGARLFNAIVAKDDDPREYGKCFDTISICLSKGLGAPVGSVLLCSKELRYKAKRMRKVFGGAMRQAGYLAAAGIYALDNHVDRLSDDHARARQLESALNELTYVDSVLPVETNIVIFKLGNTITAQMFLEKLETFKIKAVPFGAQEVWFVTHLDYTDQMLDRTLKVLKSIQF